ncbi:MAG: hypothetical protein O3B85_12305, partial [Planctomycetota bacterium]|nr:hypothetical protein [Planctomycetota bacterium]
MFAIFRSTRWAVLIGTLLVAGCRPEPGPAGSGTEPAAPAGAAAPVRAGETEPVWPDGTGTSATTRCSGRVVDTRGEPV